MRLRFIVLLFVSLLSLSLLTAACGDTSTKAPAYSYVTTTLLDIGMITFDRGEGDKISGQWIGVTYDQPLQYGKSSPYSQGITGTLSNERVTFQVAGVTVTGRLANDQLLMDRVGADGSPQTQTWVQASQSEYQTLLNAFHSWEKLRGKIDLAQQTLKLVPADSDPDNYSFQVTSVRTDVTYILGQWRTVERASDKCKALRDFLDLYPLKTNFTAKKPADSTIGKAVSDIDAFYRQASVQKLPNLAGLALPWKLSQQQVTTQSAGARDLLTQLTSAYQTAQKQMDQQKQQYDALAPKVEAQKRACGL